MRFEEATPRPAVDTGRAVSCAEFRAGHAEYLDGVLMPETAERMRRHAGECLPCARHDRAIRRGCELVGSLPAVRTGEDFRLRLRARLARDRTRRSRLISTGQLIVPGGAVIALVAAVAWSPLLRGGGAVTEPPVELAPVQARTPAGFDIPRLGNGAHFGGPRLYRASATVPGVWLGDVGLPHRHTPTLLHQVTVRDPGYPTVFLDPPEFHAEPRFLENRVLATNPPR